MSPERRAQGKAADCDEWSAKAAAWKFSVIMSVGIGNRFKAQRA